MCQTCPYKQVTILKTNLKYFNLKKIFACYSPKSPPNSPNTELATDDDLKGVYINYSSKVWYLLLHVKN